MHRTLLKQTSHMGNDKQAKILFSSAKKPFCDKGGKNSKEADFKRNDIYKKINNNKNKNSL